VARAIASSAESLGAEILTGAPVARILVDGDRATGVVLESGDEIRAKAVISGVDPHRTFLAGRRGPPRREFATRIKNYKMRGSSGR
jgi:phytoene dehydrogenase-like protein